MADERPTPIQILQGRDILSIDSPYLPPATKELVRELLRAMEEGNAEEVYELVNAVTAAFPNTLYGTDLLKSMVDFTTDTQFPGAMFDSVIDPEKVKQRVFAKITNLQGLQANFKVQGVFFSPDGFLGMAFNENYGLMLQIAGPSSNTPEMSNPTKPFFRDPVDGVWFGKDFLFPGAANMGGGPPGPLGKQFVSAIDRSLGVVG